jgi:YHS domain-containing protein
MKDLRRIGRGRNDHEDATGMILRLVIGIIVIYFLVKLIRVAFPASGGGTDRSKIRKSGTGEELVEDPQCHTYVPVTQAFRTERDGKILYFCSQKCLEQYEKRS